MEGITVLDTIIYHPMRGVDVFCGIAFYLIMLVFVCGIGYHLFRYEFCRSVIGRIFCVLVIIAVIVGVILCIHQTVSSYRDNEFVEYVVTVDDSVTFNDFMTKWEVVSADDGCYHIRGHEPIRLEKESKDEV